MQTAETRIKILKKLPSREESKEETWAILRSFGYSSLLSDPDIIWAQFHKCNDTHNAENFVRQIHAINGFVKLVPGDESQRKACRNRFLNSARQSIKRLISINKSRND